MNKSNIKNISVKINTLELTGVRAIILSDEDIYLFKKEVERSLSPDSFVTFEESCQDYQKISLPDKDLICIGFWLGVGLFRRKK